MNVYQVYVIDRETLEVYFSDVAVANSEADAMLDVELSDKARQRMKANRVHTTLHRVDSFERHEVQEVRSVE